MSTRKKALQAHKALLNGSGKITYFEGRGIQAETVKAAWVGYDISSDAFTYPCIARGGGLLGVHYKSEQRDERGKRRQWWGGYVEDLPTKGYGKKPGDLAKIIPFGMETLEGLEFDSLVILCCGEEDALSLRQVGYTALSQPGAGLLEPIYARELMRFEVVVFYDAGEEAEARKDASKLERAGAGSVRVVEWPQDAPHGADINGRLVENSGSFEGWAAGMIENAMPLTSGGVSCPHRDGEPDTYTTPVPKLPSLPTLDDEALYGLPGRIVRAIEPHTEADRVALLANLLCAFGNAIGRGARLRVGADTHHLKLNVGLVGQTAKGRKGQSWGHVRELMHAADTEWAENRVLSGLSSGEGLIYAVRDEVRGRNKQGEEITLDEGVRDKRLLVLEAELASTLKVMSREGNTLSPVIRQAWDEGRLQVLTRNNPLKATDTHVSVIGHITKAELLRYLTETEAANGFANRFIWLLVGRSKELPFGGEWHRVDTAPLIKRLTSALEFGKLPAEVVWGESSKEAWRKVYGPLSRGKPGLFGAVVGRAEAQVVRLAAIYAVMDESHRIEREHLEAALALWDYAEASACYIFGDATGDPVADQILEALRAAGSEGMSRTEIRDLFKRHRSAERINQALALLLRAGRIRRYYQDTGGRPVERWLVE